MYIDHDLLLSENQAITASAASTNYINQEAAIDLGAGMPVELFCKIDEAFDNLTTLTIAIQTDDNSSFSSATTLISKAVALASLTLDAVIKLGYMPDDTEQYIRGYYTVTGTNPTAGQVTLGVTAGRQQNP
jgi:hypothetical protein